MTGRLEKALCDHDPARMTCYDHNGICCPAGCHDEDGSKDHRAAAVLALLDAPEARDVVGRAILGRTAISGTEAALSALRKWLSDPAPDDTPQAPRSPS